MLFCGQYNRAWEKHLERLRHIREQSGYSQQDLADESGVSQHTISEIELGRRRPQGRTLRKLAKVLGVEVADLYGNPEHPLGEAPPSSQLTLNGELEEERRLRYLRGIRAIVHGLARRWEKEPPKTSREIAPLYEALTAVVEQGVFDPPEQVSPSEGHELMLLTIGFERLNEIANKVEQDEERNAVVRDIREKLGA
jgi:transcriptional regulator with XRE-family HTH domain